MRKADGTGPGISAPSAYQSDLCDGVVRALKAARGHKALPLFQRARDTVNGSDFQTFLAGQRGKDSRDPPGKHRFSCARRPYE